MKKNILFLCVMLLSILSFSSCSKDDDDNGGGQDTIDINGIKYKLGAATLMGIWDEDSRSGEFTVSINDAVDGVTYINYYKFDFKNPSCPKIGDDFSKMSLTLYAGDKNSDFYDEPLNYVSGSAKVVGMNKAESEITIKFDQLKMNRANTTYIFTGTVTLLFTDNW